MSERRIEDIYPLTPMQEGMLYHAIAEPESRAYNVQMTFAIDGPLNYPLFVRCWDVLCHRHSMLRTSFVYEEMSRPMQVVVDSQRPASRFLDIHMQNSSDQREIIEREKDAELRRGFDLQAGPLMRFIVLKTGENNHTLLWTYHHILMDGWCLGILQSEFLLVYESLVRDQPVSLPSAMQPRSYAQWLNQADAAASTRYWSKYLEGYDRVTEMPRLGDQPKSAVSDPREHRLLFNSSVSADLRNLAGRCRITLNTLFEGIWALLLARYNDADDVVFGKVVSGRQVDLPGAETIVANLINTVPVRASLPSEKLMRDILHDLQMAALDALPFQHLSLVQIQAASSIGQALFDHVMVFDNYPDANLREGVLSFHAQAIHDRTHYPISLVVAPGRTISLQILYDGTRFSPAEIERISGHFETAMLFFLAHPDATVSQLEFLPLTERKALLQFAFPQPDSCRPAWTVVERFQQTALQTPDAMAVAFGERCLTYAELDARSSALAARLRSEFGIAGEDCVALMMKRSEDLMVAVLGILKANAAYVPLDLSWPAMRVSHVLRHSGARVAVADPEFHAELTSLDVSVTDCSKLDTKPAYPRVNIGSGQLAYILYTSGSTGEPKGCEIEHGALAHYLAWAEKSYSVPAGLTFGLFTPLSFDLTVTSFFLPLLSGRTLVVFPQDATAEEVLHDVFTSIRGINAVKLTPSHISLLDHLSLPSSRVQVAIVGGEALTLTQVQTLHRLNPHMRVYNEYGPTEATVGCACKLVEPDASLVTIGKPIDGSAMYILDRHRRSGPIGVKGELYIGGPNLARGYRSDPQESDRRFIADSLPPGRLFRTGDLGRWLPNGEIDYLGREDSQVKIRGYRVELAEIEAQLAAFPGITRAVVQVEEGGTLLAFVESAANLMTEDLVAHLAVRLPPWMLPSRFVCVESFPVTVNGKIDRPALQLCASAQERAIGLEPRSATERAIAEVWTEVLGFSPNLDDDFFLHGGHSLSAMQVITRVHRRLGSRIELRNFVTHPTVRALAQRVRELRPSPYNAIKPAIPAPHYDLSHAQQRLWLLHHMGGDAAYNMPKAYIFEGVLDIPALRRALALLIERHEVLRTGFPVIDGVPRQRIEPEATPVVEEIDVHDAADPMAVVRELAEAEAVRPFELDRPPLLRMTVFKLGPLRSVLLLTLHHIIGDGWSMNVLHDELTSSYTEMSLGRDPHRSPLRLQYKDFSEWQNACDFQASERFWTEKLREAPASLQLPYDHLPAAGGRIFAGKTLRRRIPSEQSAALADLARRSSSTVSNLVLCAFALTLRAAARQDEMLIGLSIANRTHVDLEPLVGFFVNILPIRLRLGDGAFSEAIEHVTGEVYQAFDHQEYPFDLLIRRMNPERQNNRQPLLNVVFGFQNFYHLHSATDTDTNVSSLRHAREFEVPFRTSKFDLCLFVTPVRESLLLELEYDRDLFEESTIERLLSAMETCIHTMTESLQERVPLSFEMLARENLDRAIVAANKSHTEYPRHKTVHALFSETAAGSPHAPAVITPLLSMTYEELETRSNRLAHFLLALNLGAKPFVALLLDRSPEMIVALLGVLKAGLAYVPLAPDVPYERMKLVLADSDSPLLITCRRHLDVASKLHWECPDCSNLLCIDSDDLDRETGGSGGIMDPQIWQHVSEQAFDDISGGGWTSSYTGEWLSREVMDEYGDNIRKKLAPLLDPESRVLDIGCASGISMFRLAPLVNHYFGTDLSPGIIHWSEEQAGRLGHQNIELAALPAHEIHQLTEGPFDVVILNSVIECFSGHAYLRDVLRKSIGQLKPEGYLFLGNIWDLDLKPAFIQSLKDFKRAHPARAARAKIDRSEELFLSKAFVQDLKHDFPEIAEISFSQMLGGAESELSRFGFDAVLRIDKHNPSAPAEPRVRQQFDRRSLVDSSPLPECAHAGSLAYMMYTSGTSGRPKGVMIEHRAVVRLVRNANYIDFGPQDRVLQSGALGFDASTFEIWAPLLNGGAVVLPEGNEFVEARTLRRLIADCGVTTLFLTSGLFNQISEIDIDAFCSLRTLLTGGEKASLHHFNTVRMRFPELRILHVYGPTENTTFSTWYSVDRVHSQNLPIGRPISNSTVLVVDEALQPVPPGQPGELCLAGDGLARGYWKDPELTAKKFVPHPLYPEQRMYRSGDLAYWGDDGELVFQRRIDTQIKIRGFRLEIEELEQALLGNGMVTSAAAKAVQSSSGETQLAAFITGASVDALELREYLRNTLPPYLVPSHIVVLERLPLSQTGKVDRGRLIVPEGVEGQVPLVPVSTPMEAKLLTLWQKLLNRADIGVTSNFFELGGHSLTVARLASMIYEELAIEVPLVHIFRAPTIRDLSAYLNDVSRFDRRLIDQPIVKMNRETAGRAVFAFPPGSGYCLAYTKLAAALPVPFYGCNFIEDDGRLESYVLLLRAAQRGPYILLGYSAGGKLAFQVAQSLESAGEVVSDVILLDSSRYLRPVSLSSAEVEEAATKFLEGITNPSLRKQAIHRMEAYRRFTARTVEHGMIQANLHVAIAEGTALEVADENQELIASLSKWDELTQGSARMYQGFGTHQEMLSEPALLQNIELLRRILSREKAENTGEALECAPVAQ